MFMVNAVLSCFANMISVIDANDGAMNVPLQVLLQFAHLNLGMNLLIGIIKAKGTDRKKREFIHVVVYKCLHDKAGARFYTTKVGEQPQPPTKATGYRNNGGRMFCDFT